VSCVEGPLASFAQNCEDVVLWRALGHVRNGRYIDIGANDPDIDSITRVFYDVGWRGLTVEPVHALAERHRRARPGDFVVEAAVTDAETDSVILHQIDDTGLSTLVDSVSLGHATRGLHPHDVAVPARRLDDLLDEAGWRDLPIHFMCVDVEGAEAAVLRSIDLTRWRPWVLVIEATAPRSSEQSHDDWEAKVLAADYEFTLFDGLSRFYVAAEHAPTLRAALSFPACPLDDFTTYAYRQVLIDRDAARGELEHTIRDMLKWRMSALDTWAGSTASSGALTDESQYLSEELQRMRATISWRLTRPLRALRPALVRRLVHRP
jgi:FkbM family methyltransferase